MNDTMMGVSQPHGSFFFDVKSGFYQVIVQQYPDAPEEATNINLAAGEQVYLKIVSLTNCIRGASNRGASSSEFSRPCIYVWNIPTRIAQADAAPAPILSRQSLMRMEPALHLFGSGSVNSSASVTGHSSGAGRGDKRARAGRSGSR
jgi:hypothetical protein